MPTKYSDIIMYLEAIATASGQVSGAQHQFWWRLDPTGNSGTTPLAYKDFVTGTVNGISPAVPIIGVDSNQTNPLQSTFYLLLITVGGNQDPGGNFYPQMPQGGPYLTDTVPPFSTGVKLANGTTITGSQIIANMTEWLGNGYPE
jgi:hypothetical protein